jgi:uncharacterized membrane protein YgcG
MSFDRQYLHFDGNNDRYLYILAGYVAAGRTPELAFGRWLEMYRADHGHTVPPAPVLARSAPPPPLMRPSPSVSPRVEDTNPFFSPMPSSPMYNDPPGSDPVPVPSPSPDFGSGGGGDFGGGGATGDW